MPARHVVVALLVALLLLFAAASRPPRVRSTSAAIGDLLREAQGSSPEGGRERSRAAGPSTRAERAPEALRPAPAPSAVDPDATAVREPEPGSAAATSSSGELEASSFVTGHVLDDQGAPVAGAVVEWSRVGARSCESGSVTTGADGGFALVLPDPPFDIEVPRRIDHVTIRRDVLSSGDALDVPLEWHERRASVEVRLAPETWLEVSVDRPDLQVSVDVFDDVPLPEPPGTYVPYPDRSARAEAEVRPGAVSVRGLWPGRCHVLVLAGAGDGSSGRGQPCAWAEATLVLGAGRNRLDLTLVPMATVEGRVVDPTGAPLAAEVRPVSTEPRRAFLTCTRLDRDLRTSADGRYRFVLPPGPWTLVAYPTEADTEHGLARSEAPLVLAPGASVQRDLTLPTARRVLVRCSAALPRDARVVVHGPVGVTLELACDLRSLWIGGLGPDDEAQVLVEGRGRGALLRVPPSTLQVELELAPLGALDVSITDASGRPVALLAPRAPRGGTSLALVELDAEPTVYRVWFTAPEPWSAPVEGGGAWFGRLPPGAYTLSLPGTQVEVEVRAGETTSCAVSTSDR